MNGPTWTRATRPPSAPCPARAAGRSPAFCSPTDGRFTAARIFRRKMPWAARASGACWKASRRLIARAATKSSRPPGLFSAPWRKPKLFAGRAQRLGRSAGGRAARFRDPQRFDPHHGGFGQRPKFPHSAGTRSASGALSGHARAALAARRADHARKNGPRRRLRSARRRLSSLLGGRALAGAAFREDVLRQFRAAEKLSARLPGHAAPALSRNGRGHHRLGESRALRSRARRLLRQPGCRHQSR